MPAFAFTIGSIGDFIALGGLSVKIGKTVYKPVESAKDYQELLKDIDDILQILSKIDICEGHGNSPMAETCLMIQIQVEQTKQAIEEFLHKRRTNTNVWSKVMWATNGSSELAEFRRKMSAQSQTLSLLLGILHSQQLSDLRVTYEQNIKDIHDIAIQSRDLLIVIDAIGNRIPIPFKFCASYELFTDILRDFFKHQKPPGYRFIDRGDYEIISVRDKRLVGPLEWSTSITPGSTVELSMVLIRLTCMGDACMRCGSEFEEECSNGWINCSSCFGRFRTTIELSRSEGRRMIEFSPNIRAEPIPSRHSQQRIQSDGFKYTPDQDLEGDDLYKFRLFSVFPSMTFNEFLDHGRIPTTRIIKSTGNPFRKLFRNVDLTKLEITRVNLEINEAFKCRCLTCGTWFLIQSPYPSCAALREQGLPCPWCINPALGNEATIFTFKKGFKSPFCQTCGPLSKRGPRKDRRSI